MDQQYQYPEFYSFPPFFSLQTAEVTRRKQLDLWVDHVVKYCNAHKIFEIVSTSANSLPLFSNKAINRALDHVDIVSVLDAVAASGYGIWLNQDKTTFGISRVKIQELAAALHKWAEQYGLLNQVETIDEISNGSVSRGTVFYQAPLPVIHNALRELEKQGLCALYDGDDLASLGVKFISA